MSDRLPYDIQRLVLDKVLSPRDHARFSCVCKLWYSIYKERTFPWFVLADHVNENHTLGLFSVYDHQIYLFSAPELEEKHICGSSHGWLVTMDSNEHVFGLYNPFSRSSIHLPPSSFKKQHISTSLRHKVILSCNPCTNPNECIIMLLDYRNKLAYCKLGDKSWTPISTMFNSRTEFFVDAIFHNGNFFVARRSQLYICNIDSEPHLTPFGPKMLKKPCFICLMNLDGDVVIVDTYNPAFWSSSEDEEDDYYDQNEQNNNGGDSNEDEEDDYYGQNEQNDNDSDLNEDEEDDNHGQNEQNDNGSDLIEYEEDDNHVQNEQDDNDSDLNEHEEDSDLNDSVTDEEDYDYFECRFNMYKLDKDMTSWRKENEIGDQILFLGFHQSISLSTSLVPNSIANTIYYGGAGHDLYFINGHECNGTFHLNRRKNILVYPTDVFDHLNSSKPIWLIQN